MFKDIVFYILAFIVFAPLVVCIGAAIYDAGWVGVFLTGWCIALIALLTW